MNFLATVDLSMVTYTEIGSKRSLPLKIFLIKIIQFNLNSSIYTNFSEDYSIKTREMVVFRLSQPV